ncbi:Thioesterase/thiol ester dehydrase-isomerase [Meira miltonrushii]|uniref:Thioesterase/thiol ester dehydrase-isomerase n=1 Tax=Meira miltonrushii TaxID=1280837 RepID=A0A316VIC1_9BASI|nr:Thioesterase/thiol ester dehydrase-isomerase [Meira miltonrushii]PWN37379.1 Thioesterase/thiol ester dehydrase-isomerase [Meira miltonrushii]
MVNVRKDVASTVDEDKFNPEVYEQGSNIGPDIAEALECEHLDADLYRSSKPLWRPYSARGVFGGQVIGQAVAVSNASVQSDVYLLHSLHSYFLLAGDETRPIYYHVSRLRDGGSYMTRLVEAKQRGRCIFVLFSSYAKPEHNRPKFAIALPRSISNDHSPSEEVFEEATVAITGSKTITHKSRFSQERVEEGSQPKGLLTYEEAPLNETRYLRVLKDLDKFLPQKVKDTLHAWIKDRQESAVEIRDALPNMYDENGVPTQGYEQAFWMRVKSPIKGGDAGHKAALAYASDINLLATVVKALGTTRRMKMMASLDHSMHFYEPFDFTQPILFFMQCQVASSGRGLVIGRFYSQSGTLIGTASQEGLVRPREDNADIIARATSGKL